MKLFVDLLFLCHCQPIQSKVKGEMLVRRCSLRGQQTEETTVKERTHNKHHDEPCDVTLAAAQLSTPQENVI